MEDLVELEDFYRILNPSCRILDRLEHFHSTPDHRKAKMGCCTLLVYHFNDCEGKKRMEMPANIEDLIFAARKRMKWSPKRAPGLGGRFLLMKRK